MSSMCNLTSELVLENYNFHAALALMFVMANTKFSDYLSIRILKIEKLWKKQLEN